MSKMLSGGDMTRIDRRGFLAGAAAVLVVAAFVPAGSRIARAADSNFEPNAFIRIGEDGKITLIMRDVEMGQGIWTGASMLMAEELDVGLDQVTPDFAPPNDKLYANPLLGLQATGGSTSIRADWQSLRKAAAITRAALVQAAAKQWGVEPAACTVAMGTVTHTASGRTASYGSLVALAVTLPLPTDAPLKDRKDWKLIGTPQKRVDTATKVNGKTVYGIDVQLPGMKIAAAAMCPVLGGRLSKLDDAAARKIPGVLDVLRIDDGVAVVGEHFWAAKQGLDALDIDWDLGPNAGVNQAPTRQGPRGCLRRTRNRRQAGGRSRRRHRRRRGQTGRGLPASLPRPCDDGADQLHRARPAGWRRGLVRHPGAGARSGPGGPGVRPAARTGRRAQPHDRRRVRAAAGMGICRHRDRLREAGLVSAEDDLDARDRHPARPLPPVLLRPHRGRTGCERQDRRLDPQGHRIERLGALGAGGDAQERHRPRRGRMRGGPALRHPGAADFLGAP